MEQARQERQTAYKVSIGSLLKETPTFAGDKFNYIEVLGRKVSRVSLIANVIDKYVSREKPYIALTIDDGTGQIRIKLFDKLEMAANINIGDTILVIGWVRYFNNELYILPEIIKKIDVRWTMVRMLELEKAGIPVKAQGLVLPPSPSELPEPRLPQPTPFAKKGVETEKIQLTAQLSPQNIKEEILEVIKSNEEGIDIDKLIMQLNYPVSEINSTITELIEEGKIYEPQPGKVRSIA